MGHISEAPKTNFRVEGAAPSAAAGAAGGAQGNRGIVFYFGFSWFSCVCFCSFFVVRLVQLALLCYRSLGADSTLSHISTMRFAIHSRCLWPDFPVNARHASALGTEGGAQGGKEKEEEKGFLAKYWMYLLPFVIMMLMAGGSPQQEGGPEAGGGAASAAGGGGGGR